MAKTETSTVSVSGTVHERHIAASFRDDYQRKVLSISHAPADHEALRSALSHSIWHVEEAFDYLQAIACLCRQRTDLVVCEYHLPGGSWRDLIGHVAAMPEPPALVVTATSAEERLREEVKNMGGYDILAKPFNPEEVRRVLGAAWRDHSTSVGVLV